MALDRVEVEHIATLARIGLTEQEVEALREQLSHVLELFGVLREVDTTNVTATAHAIDLQTVMREDTGSESLNSEEVLGNAPRREGNLFRVKAVLEE